MAMDDIAKLRCEQEKRDATDNEVNDLIPHDMHSAQDVDDLLTTIRTQGIDVLEGESLLPYFGSGTKACEGSRGHRSHPSSGRP